jgi:hypothetical protein
MTRSQNYCPRSHPRSKERTVRGSETVDEEEFESEGIKIFWVMSGSVVDMKESIIQEHGVA